MSPNDGYEDHPVCRNHLRLLWEGSTPARPAPTRDQGIPNGLEIHGHPWRNIGFRVERRENRQIREFRLLRKKLNRLWKSPTRFSDSLLPEIRGST